MGSLPVRERGLKQGHKRVAHIYAGVAPRAGAWIEAVLANQPETMRFVAPRAGAWIEASKWKRCFCELRVAPRAGAWIEAASALTRS